MLIFVLITDNEVIDSQIFKVGVVNASLAMLHALMQQEAVLDVLLHV